MRATSQLVKRINDGIGGGSGQVDVNGSVVQGVVPEPCFQGEKIETILVTVCRIGMP